MKRPHLLFFALSLAAAHCGAAEPTYLSCNVATTFYKPAPSNTEWAHRENDYTKIFRVDADQKMIAIYSRRGGAFTPICSGENCAVDWKSGSISIDGSKSNAAAVAPFLDFRRSLTLSNNKLHYTVADYGVTGKQNMRWVYDGDCQGTAAPVAPAPRAPGAPPMGAPGMRNPNYVDAGAAMAVSKAEADQALASYYGNTMWGYSGGKHWFHMWFLDGTIAYTGDDEDITGEGKPRTWYVGKDSSGYRLCGAPIPATGSTGCYPLPVRKLGEAWVQQDMDGPAYFSLLPGRQ